MRVEGRELFSEKVSAGSRTYFFDVRESTDKTKYLVVSESRPGGGKSHRHDRVMIFEEHLSAFREGFRKALDFMDEKKKREAPDLEQIRRKHPKAYAKWTKDEDIRLRYLYTSGKTPRELADTFQRKASAIRSRLRKLGLV